MKPKITGYSINRNDSALVYSRRVGKMKVEHVFPTGIDPATEEIMYDKFRKQVADLVVKDIANQRANSQ
jgi:hypothetical protein